MPETLQRNIGLQATPRSESFKEAIKLYLIKWSIAHGIFMGAGIAVLVVNLDAIAAAKVVTYGVFAMGINLIDLG